LSGSTRINVVAILSFLTNIDTFYWSSSKSEGVISGSFIAWKLISSLIWTSTGPIRRRVYCYIPPSSR